MVDSADVKTRLSALRAQAGELQAKVLAGGDGSVALKAMADSLDAHIAELDAGTASEQPAPAADARQGGVQTGSGNTKRPATET